MPKTYYLANKLLDHTLRNTPYTSPTSCFVGLFLNIPTADGITAPIEPLTGYIREPVTFGASAAGQILSSSAVLFTANSDWGDVLAYGYFDSASGGNLLYFKPLLPTRTFLTGDTYLFPIGTLAISEL